ncbi:hypothetical protein HY417_01245 [Candidatus Kaiserbacteria bacterium]|nr:hypothetical protein [Candidatus Kaiserbacteria bacterium]
MSAKILPIDSFIFLFTKIFPFLTLNILWIRIPMVLCIAVLIATRKEKILNFCVLCFVVLSVSPLFLWPIDYKLQKIDAAPDFFQNKISVLPTLFYPFEVNHASKIALNALPYPIDPSSNSRYHHLFSNNSRLASSEQLDLYKLSLGRPESSWIFGLKDVFVFKDIADFKTGQFDWYEEHDYKQISEYYMDRFSREQLSVLEENPVYAHFKLQNSDNHDFLIYSPKMIIVATSTESYPNLDVDSIPLLFLSEQLSSLDDISFSDLASSLSQDIRLQVKYSYIDPTRYYLKVSAANKRLPLTIHLNQTFNPRWKIYVVNKTVWDSKLCKTEMSDFPITQNATCEYQYSVKDYFSISLLDRNIRGIDSRHLSGNIIGNTFLIKPNTLDEYSDSDGAIYLMIYFQKQDYYVIMLSLFVSIITALSCFVAFRRIKSLGAHKEHIYLHVI